MIAKPEATADCLHLCARMGPQYGGATQTEMHAMGYLACLLSIYDGMNASSWGYEFVSAGPTSPFSQDIQNASEVLVQAGQLLHGIEDRYVIGPRGRSLLNHLQGSARFAPRMQYLDAAVDAANALPLPAVRNAIASEPNLARNTALSLSGTLLDEVGVSALHGDFSTLEASLGREVDLAMPAILWLSFLLTEPDLEGRPIVEDSDERQIR